MVKRAVESAIMLGIWKVVLEARHGFPLGLRHMLWD